MAKYERAILENTKLCLLTSQPTAEEWDKWESSEHQALILHRYHKIKFSKEQVQVKTFCPSCKPRHWETMCKN